MHGCNVIADDSGLCRAATRTIGRIAATIAVAFAIAATARYGLVERDDLGLHCQSAVASAWCELRLLVVRAFLHHAFGLSSTALAVLAAWRRSALMAHLALAIGTAGMVLYDFTGSGLGLLGSVMVLARLQEERQQDRGAQQHARRTPAE